MIAAPTESRPLTVAEFGEHALIARITGRLSMPSWVLVGPGDDAAVIAPERGTFDVLTTDAQVEGVHFDRRFVPPDAIGHRALAVNLSDLAAMGARPRAALLSLILPGELAMTVIDGLLDGLLALAKRHHLSIVGGNVTRSPGPLAIDITAIGSVRERNVLRRSGARPGDEVYVTGTVGGAAVGLRRLQAMAGGPEGPPLHPDATLTGTMPADATRAAVEADLQVRLPRSLCEERYLRPEPRVRVGMLLGRNRAASSCMDLSDGLGDAVRQVAAASGVGMVIDESAIPLGEGVADYHQEHGADAVLATLAGGDDYELMFTVRPSHRGRLRAVRRMAGDLPITRIGVVTREPRLVLRSPAGDRDIPAGFEHFR